MKKKKILVSLTYYLPNISGVTLYAERLVKGLVKRGYQVTVLTSGHQKELPREEFKNGVRIWREKVHFRLGKGVFMLGLPWTAWREVRRHDVVNCHLPQFESFLLAIIAKIQGKKLVLTHHTDLSGWSGFLNRLSETAVWAGQLIAGLLAERIVSYTKDYADYSWYLRLFKRKLVYILPPITKANPSSSYQSILKRKIMVGVDNKIGFCGRVAKQKGIPHLLKAIRYLKEFNKEQSFKIFLAGPFKEVIGEKYFEEISDLIEKNQEYLVFLGSLNQEQLAAFYRAIDVLVLPSDDRLESFGLVQVEAMINGCPVVVSDLPGVRQPVLMTGGGRLTPVGNPKKLAKNIMAVLERRREYSRKALRAREIFAYQKTLDQYEAIFSS